MTQDRVLSRRAGLILVGINFAILIFSILFAKFL